MLVVSSQSVHRKPTLISVVILAEIRVRTAKKNRNKPAKMECAKGVLPRYRRTDTRVLVRINQLFHKETY